MKKMTMLASVTAGLVGIFLLSQVAFAPTIDKAGFACIDEISLLKITGFVNQNCDSCIKEYINSGKCIVLRAGVEFTIVDMDLIDGLLPICKIRTSRGDFWIIDTYSKRK